MILHIPWKALISSRFRKARPLSDFAIYDGDKRMGGEIMERGKARQIYNEIVRKMIDPGLLEYAGKDLFQASVFPIMPRSTRKIELAYTQVLKNEGGTVFYRYETGLRPADSSAADRPDSGQFRDRFSDRSQEHLFAVTQGLCLPGR